MGLREKTPPPLDVSSPETDLGDGWGIPKKRKRDYNPDDGDNETITELDDKIMMDPKEYINRLEKKVEEQKELIILLDRQVGDLLYNNANTLRDAWYMKKTLPPTAIRGHGLTH